MNWLFQRPEPPSILQKKAMFNNFKIDRPGIIAPTDDYNKDTFLQMIKDERVQKSMTNKVDENGYTVFMHVINVPYFWTALIYILNLAKEKNYSWLNLGFQNKRGNTALMEAISMLDEYPAQDKPNYCKFLKAFLKIDPGITNLGAKNKDGVTAFDMLNILDLEELKNYISTTYPEFDTTQSSDEPQDIPDKRVTEEDSISINISNDDTGINIENQQEIPVKKYLIDGIEQMQEDAIPESTRTKFVQGEDGRPKKDENGKFIKETQIIEAIPAKEEIISTDKSDLIVFKSRENYFFAKRSYFTNKQINNSTFYECTSISPGGLPAKGTINPESKILNLKKFGIPTNPILFEYLSFILNKKYNMFEIVDTDTKFQAIVSKYIYDSLDNPYPPSIVSASHCQSGTDTTVAKLKVVTYNFVTEGGKKSTKNKRKKYSKKRTNKRTNKRTKKTTKKTKKRK